jgi:hypothetical protein
MRYFFHLEDGSRIGEEDGKELPDNLAAMREAQVMASDLPNKEFSPASRIIITDQAGINVGDFPLMKDEQFPLGDKSKFS